MQKRSDSRGNPSVAVIPPVTPRMPWRVAEVKVLTGYRLHVRFLDGAEGIVDLTKLVRSPEAGIFTALMEVSLFGQAFVEHGAVCWPSGIDLAPDTMYAAIKKDGRWVPQ